MKDGICPMCKSNEVYVTENRDNLRAGSLDGLAFSAGEGRSTDVYYGFDYVCLNCGNTAMFAKATSSGIKGLPLAGSQGLSFLKKAMGWKKAGQPARP